MRDTNTCWTIEVSQETDRDVRAYLAGKDGEAGDLSRFVEEAVEERLYHLTVEEAQARGESMSDDELEALVDEAVRWARSSA